MKPICLTFREGRWDWIRLGNSLSRKARRASASKNNRYYASSHHHGGVCVVGMQRSDIETNREILMNVEAGEPAKTTRITSHYGKGALVYQEVGVAHSSVETSVMERGAKEPYLVDVNREAKEERWLENRY